MALGDLLRSRLALRIYLVGLAQFAAVALSLFALLTINHPDHGGPLEGHARYVVGVLEPQLGDHDQLQREVQRLLHDVHAEATVVDPDGAVLASTASPGAVHCRPDEPPQGDGPRVCVAMPLRFPGGRAGHLEFLAFGRPPPVSTRLVSLVLVVVGVSSWLLARSLTRPLRQLSSAARAFGAGDRAARAGLQRRDELGEVSRAFDEMADRVTSLLRAEKELLANVSHELRTPLARIRVALDLATEGDAEMARESLAEIAGDLDELERLISDVLTAARLDLGDGSAPAGIPPLRRQPIDLAALLGQAEARFRSAHPGRPLLTELSPELPALDGDPVLLRRVFDNLLENAHKYTERPDASITLAARPHDGGVEVEVIDRGIGIEPDDLARVFRPFFRADRSRTRATGGLGLGLALARRIVDAHGGAIELLSTPGEGTRARVRLPAAG